MKTSHTPGKWEAHGQAVYSGETYIAQCWDETSRELDSYADAVGDIPVPDNGHEAQANARLIAAAPELLEALRFAVSALDVGGEQSRAFEAVITMANAAIAKATTPATKGVRA